MPLWVVGDVHAANHRKFGGQVDTYGVNQRLSGVLHAIDRVGELALKQSAATVYAGDLLDSVNPGNPVLNAIMDTVASTGDEVHVLLGNHEYTHGEAHAINVLGQNTNIKPWCEPKVIRYGGVRALLIPYSPDFTFEQLRELVTAKLWDDLGDIKVVVSHFGIKGENTPPWLKDAAGAFYAADLETLCDELDIRYWASGDWHSYHKHSKRVYQIGALVPTGFDNPGFDYGRVLEIRDNGKIKVHVIPGPRFENYPSLKMYRIEAEDTAAEAKPLYGRITVKSDKVRPTIAALTPEEQGRVEVLSSTESLREQTQEAAEACASADTFNAKLAAFVGAMPLPEGVTAPEAESKTLQYWKGA